MRVIVVYKPESEHATTVETYLHDFERQTSHRLETLNPESPEGADTCRTYDIVEYPTLMAPYRDWETAGVRERCKKVNKECKVLISTILPKVL